VDTHEGGVSAGCAPYGQRAKPSRSRGPVHRPARRILHVAVIALVFTTAGLYANVGQAFAKMADALVVSRANDPGEGPGLTSGLRALGYTVVESSEVPSDLSAYRSVWSAVAYKGLTAGEEEALERYVKEGGRLYLTGVHQECCQAINQSDQRIARAVLTNEAVEVGGFETYGEWAKVNTAAKDGVTQRPHHLKWFLGYWAGGLRGIDELGENHALGFDQGTPTGAVFDETDMKNGEGRLIIYMEAYWLLPGFSMIANRNENEQLEMIENLADFLKDTPGRNKLPPGTAEYVALGDSYAAGVGSFEYIEGTTGKGGCYKAANGYVERLAVEEPYSSTSRPAMARNWATCSKAGIRKSRTWARRRSSSRSRSAETTWAFAACSKAASTACTRTVAGKAAQRATNRARKKRSNG
jgi:hypothetical protein